MGGGPVNDTELTQVNNYLTTLQHWIINDSDMCRGGMVSCCLKLGQPDQSCISWFMHALICMNLASIMLQDHSVRNVICLDSPPTCSTVMQAANVYCFIDWCGLWVLSVIYNQEYKPSLV